MFSGLLAMSLALVQAQTADQDADPVICKSQKIAEVGTRMKRKQVCMLRSQWNLEKKTTQRGLQELTDKGRHPGNALGRN